jgi:hypothetical protein
MATWSIAMSGGGHRASLFGLGALLYCADAGLNSDVTSIASVSGGSITNGYVGSQLDYATTSGPVFEQAMKPLVRRCAVTGTVQWAWETLLLLAAILAGVALAVVAWFLPVDDWLQVVLFLVGLLAALALTQLRSWVADRVLRRQLFTRNGRAMTLADLNPAVAHVMCATELQSKVHAYFGRTFVYDFEYGITTGSTHLPLSTAVQASACLPGAFSPRLLSAKKLGFTRKGRDWMWLVDGGVYDNMGEQFAQGFATRARDDNRLAAQIGAPPDNLLVVNSSGREHWKGAGGPLLRVPLISEVLALLREKSILYQGGTSTRRSAMIVQFDLVRYLRAQAPNPERDERLVQLGPSGTLVHIATSPNWVFKNKDLLATLTPAQRAACERVHTKLTAFGNDDWVAGLGKQSSGVKTTLAKLGRPDSMALLWHGYMLAMANLHVFFDAPLFDAPSRERFESLMD